MTFKPSDAQQRFYDWVEADTGNAILNAVAGAGKTTTILNGISKMHGKVWFGVYNKKMADEIKEKMAARKDLAQRTQFEERRERVTSSTFHSLGFAIINNFLGRGNRAEVDEKKVRRIIDAVVAEKEALAQERLQYLRDLVGPVEAMVSLAKNRGFVSARVSESSGLDSYTDHKAWMHLLNHFDLIDSIPEGEEDTAIRFATSVLAKSNNDTSTVDMDDMVYLPLARNMRLAPWHQFDWVLIDEAQDTNPTRRALAMKVLAPRGRMVAVGDPHQAIFGFTGADNDSLEQLRTTLDAIELPLTVTYRCPKVIVSHAQRWVNHIEAHESAPEGQLTYMPYHTLIDALKMTDRSDYSETAILSRYNKYLVGLCFRMIREGMPAKIEGRSIGENLIKLATRWKTCKTVNGLETKLREYEEREVAKALAKEYEEKADRIKDEVATLIVMIERAREQKLDRVTDLVTMIEDIFADNVSGKNLITLCSCHKSKGLEWNTVYLLDREAFMPAKFAKQDWQIGQEHNLIYVAVTRAKEHLIEVTGVIEERDPTQENAA